MSDPNSACCDVATIDGSLIISDITLPPHLVSNPSPPTLEEQEVRSPSPNIILRCENDFLSSQKSAWDSSSDVEEEAEGRKVPDVRRDDLASRRAHRSPVAPKVHQFVPPPVCSSKDRERWEGIRRASQQTLQEKEIRLASGCLRVSPIFFHFLSNLLLNILSHSPTFIVLFGCCGHLWFDVCLLHLDVTCVPCDATVLAL